VSVLLEVQVPEAHVGVQRPIRMATDARRQGGRRNDSPFSSRAILFTLTTMGPGTGKRDVDIAVLREEKDRATRRNVLDVKK